MLVFLKRFQLLYNLCDYFDYECDSIFIEQDECEISLSNILIELFVCMCRECHLACLELQLM